MVKKKETKFPENEKPNVTVVNYTDSIKITKNTKGYNYEFRLVAKEGVDMIERADYVKQEIDTLIGGWERRDRMMKRIKGDGIKK